MEQDDQKGRSHKEGTSKVLSRQEVVSPPDTNGVETLNRSSESKGDEISIRELAFKVRDWYRYLRSKSVMILIAALIGAVIGFTYALLKKPVFTATTTFVLENADGGGGGLGQYAGIASMVGIDLAGGSGGIFQGENIIELYRSRMMIEQTLLSSVELKGEQVLLIDQYIRFNKLRERWAKTPALSAVQFGREPLKKGDRLRDSILRESVKDIQNNYLSVGKLDKKLSIIKVEVKSEHEEFAKAFNEQLVKNVNDFYVRTKTKKSLENVQILQQKTDSVRAVMNRAIYSTAAVADATPNLNVTRQVQRSAPMQRSQFSAETNKAILAELVKNLEISKISLRKETPLIQVIDQPVLPLEKKAVGKLLSMLIGASVLGAVVIMLLFLKKLWSDLVSDEINYNNFRNVGFKQ